MKNQYFGDINDYRKYGLLRAIIGSEEIRLLISWMLTPDDGSSDGGKTDYLLKPAKWGKCDSDLFFTLSKLMTGNQSRQVALIEKTSLLSEAKYYSDVVPDSSELRTKWFQRLLEIAAEADLVFLDPDIGLESNLSLWVEKAHPNIFSGERSQNCGISKNHC